MEPKGREPDYKGDGVAVRINQDKNGKNYLSVKILNSIRVNAFRNEPKQIDPLRVHPSIVKHYRGNNE